MYTNLDFYTYYDTCVWLAFLVATGASVESLKKVFALTCHYEEDALLVRIYNLLTGEKSFSNSKHNKLLYPTVYKPLMKVFDVPEMERPQYMKKFVEGWYKSLRPMAWHNNHKGGEGAYFGYWCFEAALVVNLLKIDDSSFRDNVYYPKDLVIRE